MVDHFVAVIDRGFPGTPLARSIISRAMRFACEKHAAQTRKGSRVPYFCHPIDVGVTLAWAGQDCEVIAAGFLHDVKEDCGVGHDVLVNSFGRRVAKLVDEVTNVTTREDGPREVRQAMERQHLSAVSPEAMTLKLADSLCNMRDIIRDEPKFAPKYLAEKRLLIPLLKGGHPVLYELAWEAACRIDA